MFNIIRPAGKRIPTVRTATFKIIFGQLVVKARISFEFWRLTHFQPMFHFYAPWKQKTYGFLMLSGGDAFRRYRSETLGENGLLIRLFFILLGFLRTSVSANLVPIICGECLETVYRNFCQVLELIFYREFSNLLSRRTGAFVSRESFSDHFKTFLISFCHFLTRRWHFLSNVFTDHQTEPF